MADPTAYEGVRKLIYWHAHRIQRRLYAAGASMELEDIVSEINIVWCVARDKFDPQQGVAFSAYLSNGIKQWVIRWSQKQVAHGRVKSLEAESEDEGSLFETLADDQPLISETYERRQAIENFIERLPPRAQQYLRLISDPPPEIVAIERALVARHRYARKRGFDRFAFKDQLSRIVFEVMGVTPMERKNILELIQRRSAHDRGD